MGLMRFAAAGAAGYALYRMVKNGQQHEPRAAAFADGEATAGFAPVRNAGPDAMASDLDGWDGTDEASDESFPASDPPSH